MKNLFAAIILAALCFLVTACGGGECDEQCKAEVPDTTASLNTGIAPPKSVQPAPQSTIQPVNCLALSCK
jgi:hypothetical protein